MKTLTGMSAAFCLLAALGGTARAHEVATRCTAHVCSHIVCNRTGDRCRRFDEVRGESANYEDYRFDRPPYDRYERSWRDDERSWRESCDPEDRNCLVENRWWEE